MNLIHNMCLEIILLKLLPHLPEANELNNHKNTWEYILYFQEQEQLAEKIEAQRIKQEKVINLVKNM